MPSIDWGLFWALAGKIAAAFALTLPSGWVHEKEGHGVGVRTFPIVAMASCGYLLVMQTGTSADNSRVLQGLVAGIGFVGGGAILKDGVSIHGTATAASIWNTGAIGAACAMGRWEVAIILAVLNLLTMEGLVPLKRRLDKAVSADPHREDLS